MEREEAAVRDLYAWVDEVLDVAHAIEGERPQEAFRLVHASHGALSTAGPVRVPIAARILLVSDKTVRAWVEDGLLIPQAVRPRLLKLGAVECLLKPFSEADLLGALDAVF